MLKKIIEEEARSLKKNIGNLDRKVVIIFLSVALLQTVSWYYTSRRFFRQNLYSYFTDISNAELYNYLYWFAGDFITYLLIPFLIVKYLFHEKISSYGLKAGNFRLGISITIVSLIVMIPLIWFISPLPSFTEAYPQLPEIKESLGIALIFEVSLFFYLIAWEFIWRGFMLFGLEGKFGYYAVLIQMIPFVILHNGKPEAETFSAIIGAVVLGILALRTRSIIYGIIVHFCILFFMDLISILRYRAGEYGVGPEAVLNIIKSLF